MYLSLLSWYSSRNKLLSRLDLGETDHANMPPAAWELSQGREHIIEEISAFLKLTHGIFKSD